MADKKKVKVDEEEKIVEETQTFEFEKEEKSTKEEKADDKYNQLYGQYLRLQADFDNYKKRNASLSTSMYNEGVNDVLINVLPTIDSLDMAIKSLKDEKQKEGIEMVRKVFIDTLSKKYKVEEMKVLGEEFDPNFHDAVMNRPDPENEGKVVEVLKNGYVRDGKVLRHEMVIVGQ